ncbi:MAG: hypothetical protein WBA97_10365 [Actinophytocola sp.]|uniref:hypothetical protein n=1 Tax=Actinophytocola sp. TaxID=1872138 RepID=UPI003C733F9F
MSRAGSVAELLDATHVRWCGPDCEQTVDCSFLHFPRRAPAPPPVRSVRSARPRYNKDTADLFSLMGGDGYRPGTPQVHEENLWPLLRTAMTKADDPATADQAYTDWTGAPASSASETVAFACRDSIQWMANWCGGQYADQPTAVHYIAFSTICDDLCIPPTDLVRGRFLMYGRSVADLAAAMDEQGWRRDGVHALLSLVRQYIVQYVEKVHDGLHPMLNSKPGVWDAVIYRTHTANTYGAAVVVRRVCKAGPVSWTSLMDSSICDAISMDLCKATMNVYQFDNHPPAAHENHEQRRKTAYHSLYLDLIDALVAAGAPDAIVHFGRAGFLFVQLQERYHERRLGHRLPLRPAMITHLTRLFGARPTDPLTDHLFLARRADQERTAL